MHSQTSQQKNTNIAPCSDADIDPSTCWPSDLPTRASEHHKINPRGRCRTPPINLIWSLLAISHSFIELLDPYRSVFGGEPKRSIDLPVLNKELHASSNRRSSSRKLWKIAKEGHLSHAQIQ
jgi:hypothetical protein